MLKYVDIIIILLTAGARDTQDDFTEKIVTALEERLCGQVYIPISAADKSFLASVARVTLEVS